MLNSLLQTHLGIGRCKVREEVRRDCVRLLFRKVNNRTFTKEVKEKVGACPQVFKDALLWSGPLIKDFKLFTIYAKKKKLEEKEVLRHASKYSLSPSDAKLFMHTHDVKIPRHIPAYSIAEYNRLLEGVAREVGVFTKKFVYRKMRFIINSTGCEANDLVSELIGCALQSVSYMFPYVDSYGHLVNIAKQTIHQRGVNLMISNATDKRKRTQSSSKGGHEVFINTIIPVLEESKLKAILGNDFNSDNLSTGIEGNDRDLDLKLDVQNILESAAGKRKVFVGLLLGEFHSGFTRYLRSEGVITQAKTNQDLFDRRANTAYVEHAIRFSKLDQKRGKKIVRGLRKTLCHYRN